VDKCERTQQSKHNYLPEHLRFPPWLFVRWVDPGEGRDDQQPAAPCHVVLVCAWLTQPARGSPVMLHTSRDPIWAPTTLSAKHYASRAYRQACAGVLRSRGARPGQRNLILAGPQLRQLPLGLQREAGTEDGEALLDSR
jgi:hypothetical protein